MCTPVRIVHEKGWLKRGGAAGKARRPISDSIYRHVVNLLKTGTIVLLYVFIENGYYSPTVCSAI